MTITGPKKKTQKIKGSRKAERQRSITPSTTSSRQEDSVFWLRCSCKLDCKGVLYEELVQVLTSERTKQIERDFKTTSNKQEETGREDGRFRELHELPAVPQTTTLSGCKPIPMRTITD